MKKLFTAANQYVRESDWKTIAVLKFCLLSLGMLFGMLIPQKSKKPTIVCCLVLFVTTYILLIAKLAELLLREDVTKKVI